MLLVTKVQVHCEKSPCLTFEVTRLHSYHANIYKTTIVWPSIVMILAIPPVFFPLLSFSHVCLYVCVCTGNGIMHMGPFCRPRLPDHHSHALKRPCISFYISPDHCISLSGALNATMIHCHLLILSCHASPIACFSVLPHHIPGQHACWLTD